MILNRLGNKKKIATKIISLFPNHEIYIEFFFGAGGIFFNKPQAKYNFCNDYDDDVINLFRVVKDAGGKENFKTMIMDLPLHQKLFREWQKEEEPDPLYKALRFLMVSNLGFLGDAGTMKLGLYNPKKTILQRIDITHKLIQNVQFLGCSFEHILPKLGDLRDKKSKAFIYADPPYLDTANNYYNTGGFNKKQTEKLIDILCASGIKFAMSEFDHPFVLELVEKKGLNVVTIGERQNLKNRRTEILIMNYAKFDLFSQLG